MYENLIIGIDQTSDIDQLLTDGIRQFYLGYIPVDYEEKYSTQTSLNRRYRRKEQFTDIALAREVVSDIHNANGTIYLALNAITSNQTMLYYTEEVYKLFSELVDGIIVANITIAMMLKKRNYPHIIISNLFGVYNIPSVAFLIEQFAPHKIILPRDISLFDIEQIVTAYPEQKFECFLYGDNCRYSESFCFVEHGYDSIGFGSLCTFASREQKLVKAPSPNFKQIVKSSKLEEEEKRNYLRQSPLDISSLLDQCQIALYEEDSATVRECVEILDRFDSERFKESKAIYIRAITVLKSLDTPLALKIEQRLLAKPYEVADHYRAFHNLNSHAITETLRFFERFDNIVSYKIPSRGRNLYKYLSQESQSNYNYKESQYRI